MLRLPSPIIKLDGFLPKECECNFFIKKESAIHQSFGGNKWRKLKYNIAHFLDHNYSHLVTFGGPFSNHIAATAAASKHYNIPSIGIIRGTYNDHSNPTLIRAKENGMQLHHVSKEAYRQKELATEFLAAIKDCPKPYIIPEGGDNELALKGISEMVDEIESYETNFDYIVLSAGTGSTARGVIKVLHGIKELLVVNALKNASLCSVLNSEMTDKFTKLHILDNYHFGGFAKVPNQLVEFCNQFHNSSGIKLDPIYNAKTLYAISQEVKSKNIRWGSNILMIETGGLQGIQAYNYTCKDPSMQLYPAKIVM